jgi:hypothetical protein
MFSDVKKSLKLCLYQFLRSALLQSVLEWIQFASSNSKKHEEVQTCSYAVLFCFLNFINGEWLCSAIQLNHRLLLCLLLLQFLLGFHLPECRGAYFVPCRLLWHQFYNLNLQDLESKIEYMMRVFSVVLHTIHILWNLRRKLEEPMLQVTEPNLQLCEAFLCSLPVDSMPSCQCFLAAPRNSAYKKHHLNDLWIHLYWWILLEI